MSTSIRSRLGFLVFAAVGLGAEAQSAAPANPDESWSTYSAVPAAAPSTAPPAGPETLTAPPLVDPPYSLVGPPLVPPEYINRSSIFAAPTLGRHRWGFAATAGFPYLAARVVFGVAETLDIGAQFETLYGSMNDVRLNLKWKLVGTRSALALVASAGPDFFGQSAVDEVNGARWMTGRRNWNAAPGLVFSFAPSSWSQTRFFVDARCELAIDTEPLPGGPLTGTPAAVQVSANVPILVGTEIPLSATTAFTVSVGIDFHGRSTDSPVMPMASVGLVTAP